MSTEKLYFSKTILHWFKKNERNLPWRNTKDPYKIWLSEIILQQTRVAQGMPYYFKFVEKYPDIQLLANAPIDVVLRTWQGLGYYSRARNLHETAKLVVNEFNGKFPDKYTELLKLKGVGSYTAAAIASFASNEPVAVVDGNVYRVLARYFGLDTDITSTIGKKEFQELANSQLPQNQAGDHNQAIMEFGALQCVPKNPDCLGCPLASTCVAVNTNKVTLLPVKLKKVRVKQRYFYYFLPMYNYNGKLMMRRRSEGDVWQGLYDFPSIESSEPLQENELLKLITEKFLEVLPQEKPNFENFISRYSVEYRHQLTHQRLFVRFINISELFLDKFEHWCTKNDYLAYSFAEAQNLPKPIILANYLAQNNN
jgi:A/G-specific adenine glycosylase